MAAATTTTGEVDEADVVNPIVFFDITLGGEFVMKTLFFSLLSFEEAVCVCVFYLFK